MEKEYKIRICGNECSILSGESQEFITMLAKDVETRINEVYSANSRTTFGIAAMIASMSLCEELHHIKEGSDNLRAQLKSYLDEASSANTERDSALSEVEKLQRELDMLRQRDR